MATIRLVPSSYRVSSTYLSVSDASNMYTNTDSTNYATVQNTRSGTSSYYIYIQGFNFDSVPNNAIVSDIQIKLKAYHSGGNTGTIDCYTYNGTTATAINAAGSTTALSTSATVHEFTNVTIDWDTLKGYGDDFSIRINGRRASRNTAAYLYIYGAEIEVTYTIPEPVTITSTLTGNGTIVPSGATSLNKGDEYSITITPTNESDQITVTNNGVDVTSQLVPPSSGTEDRVLGAYALVSGSFNGSGATYFQGLVGKGVDNTKTTSNYYSGGNGTIAVFTYDMSFDIPAGSTIKRVWCQVNGHAESTSQSSEYMCVQLISGNTDITEELNFKNVGTSNSTQTLEATNTPTVAQLAQMKLKCRLGYYGGAINGATAYVSFESNGYSYTYITTGNATIAVVIGGSGPTTALYFKENGTYIKAIKAWKKVNGVYVEQDITTVFQSGVNYRKGGN